MCFGNTARSPAAQGIAEWLKNTKYQDELEGVQFDSAGFFNVYKTAQEGTIRYLKEKGIDYRDFRGKIVDSSLLEKQDLILVMQERHLKRLMRKFKDVDGLERKAHIIREFAGETEDIDIPDPVNKSDEEYKRLLEIVEDAVKKSVERIVAINNSHA